MVKLSIIILSFNTKKLTLDCIRSIFRIYKKNIENNELEIVVSDNDSKDGTIEEIEKIKEVRLVKNSKNFGFSKGNNLGERKANGKYILFLNSDTEIKDDGFVKMIDFMDKNEKIGVLGAKLLNPNGKPQKSCGNFYTFFNLLFTIFGKDTFVRKSPNSIQEVDWISGASFMMRKDVFDKTGGFDEDFFMYIEDMELCYRVKKMGYKTYFYPNIKLIHKELGSGNRTFAILNIYKGIILFYKKHLFWQYPFVKFILFIKASLSFIIGVLTNNDYLKKTYFSALRTAI